MKERGVKSDPMVFDSGPTSTEPLPLEEGEMWKYEDHLKRKF